MLPLLTLVFAAGIAAGDAELLGVATLQALCVQAAVLGAAARGPRARCVGALAVAFAAGALLLAERRATAWWPSAEPRVEAIVAARVTGIAVRGDRAVLDLADVRRAVGRGEPLPARVRVYVPLAPRSPLAAAVPGDRVRAHVRLKPVVSRFDPGTPDPAERLRRAGIGGTGSLVHPSLAWRAERGTALRLSAGFRARRAAAARALAAQGAGLAGALALGAREGLPEPDAEAMRSAGLTHLLAVSGLNLAMVAGLAFWIARRALLALAPRALADPRRAALAAAWLASAGYAALAGFEVSVQRALAFLTVACAALWLRRPVSASEGVALAGLAVLAMEPAALFEPGAQLSFAAAAALLVALPAPEPRPPLVSRTERVRAWLRAAVAVSAAALAATAPLVAFHFGRLAPGALLANLVAVPLTELVLLPLSLVAALLALAAPGLAALFAAPAAAVHAGGEVLVLVARMASAGPAAELAVGASPLALALAAAAGAAALSTGRLAPRLALVALGHGALAALPPAPLLPAAPRLVALDVGHGDAVLVQGRAASLLVDAGPALPGGGDLGRVVVVPALAALGVRRLDVVAASHADLDHRGGLAAVLERIPVGQLWLPHGGARDPAFAALVSLARERGVRVRERGTGDAVERVGDLAIDTLWPPRDASAAALSDNDRSLVLRVAVGATRVLLTGDLEAAAEAALLARADVGAHVLKLGHHGSRTSSTSAFLRAVGAEVALASAPCLGRFRMPHPDVARRLAGEAASLWWTGRDGAVFVGLAGPRVAVGLAPARDPALRWSCAR